MSSKSRLDQTRGSYFNNPALRQSETSGINSEAVAIAVSMSERAHALARLFPMLDTRFKGLLKRVNQIL